MDFTNIASWLVWLGPLIASLFVPLIGKFSEKARNYYVVAVAAVIAVLAFSMVPAVLSSDGAAGGTYISWIPGIDAGVYLDPLSVLFTCLVGFFGLIIAVYSQGYMKGEEGLTRYYFLILLFIGSMIGLVISDNMLQMFIFWEMVGLCSYALISFWYKKPESIRAGVKVFLMTRVGDVCLLAAVALLFLSTNTFSFRGTIENIGLVPTESLVVIAFLFLGAAISKSAQLPLFTWLYSAMEAPTSVSALLHAATMVKAGIYLLARFILIVSAVPALIEALHPLWFPAVAWIGVLTALIGACLAINTTDIKGVLAYSTISQIGFMMAGLGAAVEGAASIGWFASLFHMVSHAFFEGLGFLIAGGIIHAIGTRDMRLMGGLRKLMPVSFILMGIMILTTSGLPPFAAFFSKGLILTSVTEAGSLIQIIILYATAMLTFAYCVRMFSLVFMGKPSEHIQKQHVHELPKVMMAPAAIIAGLAVIWGLLLPFLTEFMSKSIYTEHLLNYGVLTSLGTFMIESIETLETPIFLLLLVPVFILGYYTYYKGFNGLRNIAAGKNPISFTLRHAFFFDDFYNGLAKGVEKLSSGLKHVEDSLFSNYPDKLGESVNQTADPEKAQMLKKGPSSSFRNYVAAAVLGFILIIVLIILKTGLGV
ncbi:MAG: NADH-quinone oxidoreductase subunit L [Candidatus Bathyarchaeota archaeon]|nr:NADH-quinone oxidoreductase subunit L [Candidatus Bathyarchaeota archaeon]